MANAGTARLLLTVTSAILVLAAEAVAQPRAGRASIALSDASATLTHARTTKWTLAKTGTVDAAARTLTWTVTATPGEMTPGQLLLSGQMTVTNFGAGGATLGNIVVNLQTRAGASWRTQASDIADATADDAATTALVVSSASSENIGRFTENTASGRLVFMDATTNSLFALVPHVTIAPGATVSLLFAAAFDNTVLRLRTGQAARAEVIVTFGNSGPSGASAARLDIDGSGAIDPDEDYVRSVPTRLGVTVPAETDGDAEVTLSDTVDDVTTTGTVTFSNPVFDLAGTSGTVMVGYDPGAAGGTITNCAHLRRAGSTVTSGGFTFPNTPGVDLEACDTQVIAPRACTPGAPGCGWSDGDMVTYHQDNWGGDPTQSTAAALLLNRFGFAYTDGFVEVGINGVAGYSMILTSAAAVLNYLPANGGPGALNVDLLDPTSTSSGVFGGFVLALQLDVDLADAGYLAGTSGIAFGDLRICGLTTTPAFNGLSVRRFLAAMNTALGLGPVSYNFDDIAFLTEDLTRAFEGGTPSVFAQQHLVNGPCGGWADGEMVTYNQESWGGDPTLSPAAALMLAQFNTRYPAGMEVGLPGATGFSMAFTSASAILNYLPGSGAFSALNEDLVDPTSSASGTFGGLVLALQFDVDFADSGLLSGTSGVVFSDLRLCGLTVTPAYDGLTVRQFLGEMNIALGGGSTAYNFDTIGPLVLELTSAFESGSPSLFAQQHLVNGPCPP